MSQVAKLVWWQPPASFGLFPKVSNLGDALSPYIVNQCRLSAGLGKFISTSRLLAIGSILHRAVDGDVVWGSGHHGLKADSAYNFRHLDVRAVRGPITAALLRKKGIEVPDVFGDPAVLLPSFVSKPEVGRRSAFVIVPHYADRRRVSFDAPVVRTYGRNFLGFVRKLAQAETVLSASLHGIIIAESYGIPSILVRNAASETLDKYTDYYESTGRHEYPIADSFEDAARLSPPPLPSLDKMRMDLRASFPSDLWEGMSR